MIGLITGIIGTAGSLFKSWQERKKIKAEGKIRLEQAKVDGRVKHLQSKIDYDAEYDIIAAKGMQHSWKDEYWTIVLSIPAILCFIPGLTEYVRAGFNVLSGCPIWYQTCLVGVIAASFGLKSMMSWRNSRNGS